MFIYSKYVFKEKLNATWSMFFYQLKKRTRKQNNKNIENIMTKLKTQHRKGGDDNSCLWLDGANQSLVSDTKHPPMCWLAQSFTLLSCPSWQKVSATSCFLLLASKLLCSVVVWILSWVWKFGERDWKKWGGIYDGILNMLSTKCPFEPWTQAWKKYSRAGHGQLFGHRTCGWLLSKNTNCLLKSVTLFFWFMCAFIWNQSETATQIHTDTVHAYRTHSFICIIIILSNSITLQQAAKGHLLCASAMVHSFAWSVNMGTKQPVLHQNRSSNLFSVLESTSYWKDKAPRCPVLTISNISVTDSLIFFSDIPRYFYIHGDREGFEFAM